MLAACEHFFNEFDWKFSASYLKIDGQGASSKVEKEKKHYQGLPEDVGPDSGKSWSQFSRKMKIDKTERSRK